MLPTHLYDCLRLCVTRRSRRRRRVRWIKKKSSTHSVTCLLIYHTKEKKMFLCKNGIAGNIVGLTERVYCLCVCKRVHVLKLWYSEMRTIFVSFRFISWSNTVEIITLFFVFATLHVIELTSNEFRYFTFDAMKCFLFSDVEKAKISSNNDASESLYIGNIHRLVHERGN